MYGEARTSGAFEIISNDFQQICQITFANGVTVSMSFGRGAYSDGGITTCETAVIDKDGHYIKHQNDDVQGHQTPEDVLKTMVFAITGKTK